MKLKQSQGPASFSLLLLGSVCLWHSFLRPELLFRNSIIVFSVATLWAFLEKAQGGEDSEEREMILIWHRRLITFLALLIVSEIAPELAISSGSTGSRWEVFYLRLRGIFLGVGLTLWGNHLPKLLSPWAKSDEPFHWEAVHRFVGWSATITGIILIMIWWFLPIESARSVSAYTFMTFAVLAGGRKLISLTTTPRPRREQ